MRLLDKERKNKAARSKLRVQKHKLGILKAFNCNKGVEGKVGAIADFGLRVDKLQAEDACLASSYTERGEFELKKANPHLFLERWELVSKSMMKEMG